MFDLFPNVWADSATGWLLDPPTGGALVICICRASAPRA